MTAAAPERGLVLAPRGRDAVLAQAILVEARVPSAICDTVADLVAQIEAGAGFALVTEEALRSTDLSPLSDFLAAQPEWSDFPFILLTERGGGIERNPAAARYLELLGNVTVIERPFHPTTLVTLTHSALRGRRRQYEARSRLLALNESEQQFRTLANSIPTLCWMADADGTIFWYNQQWYDYTGTTPVEMDGWGWQSVHEPSYLPDVLTRWKHSIASGEELDMTFPLRSRDGVYQPFLTRVRPVRDTSGAVVRWFGTNTNIATQQAAETALRELAADLEHRVAERTEAHEQALDQLHQAQKLETIGQLTGGVAHDFNNLLTPIIGALDLLQRKTQGDDARTLRLLDGAIQSAERARVLVQRLLGFARRQVLETRAVDVADLITGMSDLIRSSIGATSELIVEAGHDLPLALADPNQLELAILNLCINSRDAMPEGGKITITIEIIDAARETIAGLTPGQYIHLAVADTGMGMDPAILARAVEPFYSTKEQGRGTGLGLSMVHGLAAQLGGAFKLESTPGTGTTASFYLALADADAPGIRRPSGDAADIAMSPLSILLVDDEDVVRRATKAMLKDMGHGVTESAGGSEALEKLNAGLMPDVLITDFKMPRMSGAQLAEQVYQKWPDLPLLIVTGYIGDAYEVAGIRVLAKPFRQSELAAALLDVVGDRAQPAS
ncbi:hybrid sensor histidine kinase/response regulator [Glacieibacterium megasporae]|uniref:hybrid sensor histidine kinase/response regulator n=1 Tax=Glacieibacterium megasporae TaxID=2835787 RepID=UPI001C1DFFD4|nr:PAS domain-containing sensor histidine kinase [Polymorphobacter megasporae]UAJ09782.1 response regulator [Polymorphobacter megasporae]